MNPGDDDDDDGGDDAGKNKQPFYCGITVMLRVFLPNNDPAF